MDKKIEKYLNDEDVMNIAWAAASSFATVLSQDEIQTCILNAMWRAANKYNKRNGTKFTSYLHTGVVFECLSQRKFNNSKRAASLNENIEDSHNPFERIDMLDAIKERCEDPSLVVDRFYNNMTIKELATSRNVCGETIRIRLGKNLENLRSLLSKSV